MANVSFHLTTPENIPDQAVTYLQEACDAIPGYATLETVFGQSQAGIGLIYIVFADNVLTGSLFINFRIVDGEKKMTLVLLGGISLRNWSNDLMYFLRRLKSDQKAAHFSILGRPGLGRMFKNLRHIACLYEAE